MAPIAGRNSAIALTSLVDWLIPLVLSLLALMLVLVTASIVNHNRLVRRVLRDSDASKIGAISSELLEEIKKVSFSGDVVDISRFWLLPPYQKLSGAYRSVVVDRLVHANLIEPIGSDRSEFDPFNAIGSVYRYAFCRPPRRVRLTGFGWSRMVDPERAPSSVGRKSNQTMTRSRRIVQVSKSEPAPVNRSLLAKSLNALARNDPGLADALKRVADFVQQFGSADDAEIMNGLLEELDRTEPRKVRVRLYWEGLLHALPEIDRLTDAGARIQMLTDG